MSTVVLLSPAEAIEIQRELAQDRHDLLGSVVRGVIRKMNDEQLEEIRSSIKINGSAWILVRIDNIDENFFYDINQKIMIFDDIFHAVRQVKPFNMANSAGYNVQIRINELEKFIPPDRRT